MSEHRQETFETPTPAAEGRAALEAYRTSLRHNGYEEDTHLKRLIALYAPEDRRAAMEEELSEFGEQVMGKIDDLVRENNDRHNLPRLNRWSDYGTRQEEIEHHPTYHQAGALMYGAGIMAAYGEHPNALGVLSRFYVSSFNGEAGHNCPMACTAGVIRVLQELGSEEQKERFLEGFLSPDYDEHLEGAQFLTEIQGGSDVGANGTRAVKDEDGRFRIYGEKWFCSNIDADVFLMTARVEELGEEGTRGLGLFLVPRELDSGEVNGFYIRRLKEKLGTRSMASGECNFDGALAYHMGEVGDGFKHMMRLVINTSRLYNAVGCCGIMRRSLVEAKAYARHREAFGQPIENYPLVQETIANVESEWRAALSGTMHLVAMQDKIDAGEVSEREQAFFRMALNLNKTQTARLARWATVEGIEVFGGNGAIETFTILPRLLRDAVVYENWEGTHNTLYMQVWRDMKKYRVHEGYFGYLNHLLEEVPSGAHEESVRAKIEGLKQEVGQTLERPMASASLAMRRIVEGLVDAYYGTVLLWQMAQWDLADEPESRLVAAVDHYFDRKIEATEADVDDPVYLQRLSLLRRGW